MAFILFRSWVLVIQPRHKSVVFQENRIHNDDEKQWSEDLPQRSKVHARHHIGNGKACIAPLPEIHEWKPAGKLLHEGDGPDSYTRGEGEVSETVHRIVDKQLDRPTDGEQSSKTLSTPTPIS